MPFQKRKEMRSVKPLIRFVRTGKGWECSDLRASTLMGFAVIFSRDASAFTPSPRRPAGVGRAGRPT
jgi:hypothetical protein